MMSIAREDSAHGWSITRRLIVLFTFSASVLVVLVVAMMYVAIQQHLDEEHEHLVAEIAHVLEQTASSSGSSVATLVRDVNGIATDDPRSVSDPYWIRVIGTDGRVLAESRRMNIIPVGAFGGTPVRPGERSRPKRWASAQGETFLLATIAPRGANGISAVQVALDITRDGILVRQLRNTAAMLVILSLVGAALAGAFVVRRTLRPLDEITAEVEGISVERLGWRLPVHARPRELSGLVLAFNVVLDRLDRAFARMSQFSANLAHELRTPLNNLRGEAEVALLNPRTPEEYRDVLASSLEEYGRLSTMIDGLLFLSRAESHETTPHSSRVDLAAEARDVCDFYSPLAEERGITLIVEGNALGNVDSDLFRRAVGNLVANSIRHTPSGGHVTIALQETGEEAIVRVTDDGAGIHSSELPKVFDRFYRGSNARADAGGSGLGLAIVRSIMDLHHGTADIQSERGRGTTVTLSFPQSPVG